MTGTPVARSTWAFHSVTTAKLPPTRKDSTIASFSEATSWPSSTVPFPDVLIRKNRAVDGSAALAPRRRRGTGSRFSCCSFRLRDSAARRFCRRCCHRIAPWPKLAACAPRKVAGRVASSFRHRIARSNLARFHQRRSGEGHSQKNGAGGTHHRFPSRVDSCKRPISFSPTIWSSLYSATRRPLGTRSVRRS